MTTPPPTRFADGFVQPNRHITARLTAMLNLLLSAHGGGGTMSAASKGAERELFVNSFLSQVFPPHFRFGSGDITDSEENKSGQLDVVIEFPNLYSFPIWHSAPRLYLAEGVAVAIEIKSDLSNQWSEVEATAKNIKSLRRRFDDYRIRELADRYDAMNDGKSKLRAYELREAAACLTAPTEDIPLFVVGYNGWANAETLCKHLGNSQVDAVLQLDRQFFVARGSGTVVQDMGPMCLMIFLEFITNCLHVTPPQSSIFHYATQAESGGVAGSDQQEGPGTTNSGPSLRSDPVTRRRTPGS
ncbi:MAG: hypothetical protein H7062_19315 [Candidatus Saccharimonas sp.]|nr:hypothetical protein [Planctomycetaceae bacterium]